MGPFLLTARLFTAGIFFCRILNDVRAAHSSALIYLAVTIQLVGVVLVVLGYKTRFGAPLLAAFCVATTVLVNWHAGVAGLFRRLRDRGRLVVHVCAWTGFTLARCSARQTVSEYLPVC